MLIKIKALMKAVEYGPMAIKIIKKVREYLRGRDDYTVDKINLTVSLDDGQHRLDNVVDTLNQAFKDDPQAIHALICNRVPCNQKLVDHPTVEVRLNKGALKGGYNVGTLGMINGVLRAAGIGDVAVMFSDKDDDGVSTIEGFCGYPLLTDKSLE